MLVFGGVGDNASGLYRVRFPLKELGWVEGTDYQIGFPVKKVMQGRKWSDTIFPQGTTALVATRPLTSSWHTIITHAQRQGIRVIVDFDDNFARIPKSHYAYDTIQGSKTNDYTTSWRWADKCARQADRVTVSSQALVKRYGGTAIPNYMPHYRFELEMADPEPQVGWAAHVQTHADDPSAWDLPKIKDWLESKDMELVHVGHGEIDAHQELGQMSTEAYLNTMAKWTASLVPLDDNEFNQSKSALKGLESMSLGVPAVASPRAEYKKLPGCYLASSALEAIFHLEQITLDTSQRERARKHAHEWCLEFHADEWERAWTT